MGTMPLNVQMVWITVLCICIQTVAITCVLIMTFESSSLERSPPAHCP